jgi:hypothetical protein
MKWMSRMTIRIWGVAGACLLVGTVGGFVAGSFTRPSGGLSLSHSFSDSQFDLVLATLVSRGIDGDLNGSMSARSGIVDRCAKVPGMLECMTGNYQLLLIDAENGSPDGMVATAIALTGSGNCADKSRAAFWLNKARALGKKASETSRLLIDASRQDRCQIFLTQDS